MNKSAENWCELGFVECNEDMSINIASYALSAQFPLTLHNQSGIAENQHNR